jgi:hypothetical protein
MLLSSRQSPPRLSLPRATSHSNLATARALLSSSPLPSPGLPSILPRHGKKPPKLNSRRILRLLLWLTVCSLLFWAASRIAESDQSSSAINYASPDRHPYQLVGDKLPLEPSPIVVTDQRGRSKWTISVPPTLNFPLQPSQYASLCRESEQVSQHVAMSKKVHSDQMHSAHHPYYYHDPHFMDIAEAQSHNLLPSLSHSKSQNSGTYLTKEPPLESCVRSLTYALETSSAGLGPSLLSLWLAYGLAQSENRAFFMDDTNWPYGSYHTYFKPPPSPGCLPPPKTQIVPCPHQARHLLVSAATTSQSFGHMFMDHFEDGRKMGVFRQHNIFAMMRAGYEALFEGKLNDEDQSYLYDRLAELNNSIRWLGREEVGIHVRHGDRHPLEYQYQKSYIPLEKYLDTARNFSTQAQPSTTFSHIIIASDDPDIYIDPLITSSTDPKVEKAQSHITLASKKSLAASGKIGLGWEGGFFKDVFWALGVPAKPQVPRSADLAQPTRGQADSGTASSPAAKSKREDENLDAISTEDLDPHTHPNPSALKLRELVGRAYLLDLAVLGQSDKIVCAVSSYGCRILAVMMGWDRAILTGGWVNVDGDFEWRGLDW